MKPPPHLLVERHGKMCLMFYEADFVKFMQKVNQLELEADWLAERIPRCPNEVGYGCMHDSHEISGEYDDGVNACPIEHSVHENVIANCWREKARFEVGGPDAV